MCVTKKTKWSGDAGHRHRKAYFGQWPGRPLWRSSHWASFPKEGDVGDTARFREQQVQARSWEQKRGQGGWNSMSKLMSGGGDWAASETGLWTLEEGVYPGDSLWNQEQWDLISWFKRWLWLLCWELNDGRREWVQGGQSGSWGLQNEMMEARPRQEPQVESGGWCFPWAEQGRSCKNPREDITSFRNLTVVLTKVTCLRPLSLSKVEFRLFS